MDLMELNESMDMWRETDEALAAAQGPMMEYFWQIWAAALKAMAPVLIVMVVLLIVEEWRIFTKSGEKGWKCVVPFLRSYKLCEISMGHGLLFLLGFLPVLGSWFKMIVRGYTATRFGGKWWLSILCAFVPVVGLGIVAFSDAFQFDQAAYDYAVPEGTYYAKPTEIGAQPVVAAAEPVPFMDPQCSERTYINRASAEAAPESDRSADL